MTQFVVQIYIRGGISQRRNNKPNPILHHSACHTKNEGKMREQIIIRKQCSKQNIASTTGEKFQEGGVPLTIIFPCLIRFVYT